MPSTIKYGSQGGDVAQAQQLLNTFGYSLALDGIFGSKTLDAVKDFQLRAGISIDGVVGHQTWSALNAPLTLASTQGGGTTTQNTVSPVPVTSSSGGNLAPYNQLNNSMVTAGLTTGGVNWKLWGIIAAASFSLWLLMKNKERE